MGVGAVHRGHGLGHDAEQADGGGDHGPAGKGRVNHQEAREDRESIGGGPDGTGSGVPVGAVGGYDEGRGFAGADQPDSAADCH